MEAAGAGGLKALVRSNWDHAVLVCRKCSKKLDGGFGPDGGEGWPRRCAAISRSKKGARRRRE
jgi:hypothetical protein